MRNKEEIKELLDYFRTIENKDFTYDEKAILTAYEKNETHQSLAIKILSIFGGILASFSFLGFLFLIGLYDSTTGILTLAIIAIAAGVFINKAYDKIIIDTISVSSYLIGFILLAVGLSKLEVSENAVSLISILIAAASLVMVRSYIIAFISVLIINGGILTLIASNKDFDMIHLYTSFLAIMLTAVFLKEAKIISKNTTFSKLYNPVRIGLVFSFLAGLIFLGNDFIEVSRDYIWISSVVIILAIMYVLSQIFEVLDISQTTQKAGIYIVTIALLLPTILSPAISGSILIILLSFLVNYKTSLTIGIMAFIYFVSRYYYDLHFTLLTKSILLFSSGILFLGLYLLTRKKLTSNEKV
ncbi:DUF4401 domain-containing protein [Chryseobacterium sp. MEBOG07]|uniref:DUF4401 domain-containing protein n=1 Tax=Chryseobacterium sp. MEBOG07 TaxID=2879939 RepID=UPI001F490F22|nr:DUF4401 domain-containing protein [Chryseobacterium sp. MEBOG07]UKB80325.1 DUF4401 domain-containing protein [Chryseobacterium sp. MEBOG07]